MKAIELIRDTRESLWQYAKGIIGKEQMRFQLRQLNQEYAGQMRLNLSESIGSIMANMKGKVNP